MERGGGKALLNRANHERGAKLVLQPPGQGGEKGGDGPAGWGTLGSWGGSGMHHVSCSCCSLIWFWWIMHGERGPVLKGHRCHSGSHYWARRTDEKKEREKEREKKWKKERGRGMGTERKNAKTNGKMKRGKQEFHYTSSSLSCVL